MQWLIEVQGTAIVMGNRVKTQTHRTSCPFIEVNDRLAGLLLTISRQLLLMRWDGDSASMELVVKLAPLTATQLPDRCCGQATDLGE